MKKGFTLVELLVVIAVLSISILLVLYIFTNSLRGSNKAQILSSIKKNGQAVLEVVDKTIRSSDNVICPAIPSGSTSASSTGLVIEKVGLYTRYRFVSATGTVNGSMKQDNPTRGSTESISNFINRVCNIADPLSSQALVLTDTNPQVGVSIQNGSFKRNKQIGFKDTVTISFQVTYPVEVSPALVGQIDPVDFATTVQLR